MPESFWNACCEVGVVKYRMNLTLSGWIGMGGLTRVGWAFKKEVGEVIRRVPGASMVIDPDPKAYAQEIVEVTPEAWETMEAFSDDELETIKAIETSDD